MTVSKTEKTLLIIFVIAAIGAIVYGKLSDTSWAMWTIQSVPFIYGIYLRIKLRRNKIKNEINK